MGKIVVGRHESRGGRSSHHGEQGPGLSPGNGAGNRGGLVLRGVTLRRNCPITRRVYQMAARRGDGARNRGDLTKRRRVLPGYSSQQDDDQLHQTGPSPGGQAH